MIPFGETLRAAREAKGYTIGQIAEITRMGPSTIEELEKEDFSRIAAPIYGRGFVKLYCEAVGLDPKPLVSEFMEIFNGNRDTTIRDRPQVPVAETVPPAPEPEPDLIPPTAPEPPRFHEASLFDVPNEPPPFRQEDPVLAEPPSAEVQPTAAPQPTAAQPAFSRYATPLRDEPSFPRLPVQRLNFRMLTAGLLLLAVLAAIGFGIRALYRATSPAANPSTDTETVAVQPAPVVPVATPARPVSPSARKPQKIPSLYID